MTKMSFLALFFHTSDVTNLNPVLFFGAFLTKLSKWSTFLYTRTPRKAPENKNGFFGDDTVSRKKLKEKVFRSVFGL